ncbi:hypothetical protein BaRGS_00000230, partial [Batillaria attramentaria]
YRSSYSYDILAFFIPLLLLAVSNAATVWKFRQHGATSGASRERHQSKSRRLTLTMIVVSVTCLVAYPFAISIRLIVSPNTSETELCDEDCKYIIIYVCALMTTLNSSINIVFYCAFASRFRQLLVLRFSRLFACRRT